MDLDRLQHAIGHTFADPPLLELAVTHRSYVNEHREVTEHNERLEFLGDAVLELIVTEELYRSTQRDEGELTAWRSALVRTEQLAEVSRLMGVGAALRLSRGEEGSGGRDKNHILANAYEAILGAIYLDGGIDAARAFVHRTVLVHREDVLAQGKHVDPKSRFQELAQLHLGVTPEYKLLWEKGPDHAKEFCMAVCISDEEVAEGTGASKQAAEQEAARAGLVRKQWT